MSQSVIHGHMNERLSIALKMPAVHRPGRPLSWSSSSQPWIVVGNCEDTQDSILGQAETTSLVSSQRCTTSRQPTSSTTHRPSIAPRMTTSMIMGLSIPISLQLDPWSRGHHRHRVGGRSKTARSPRQHYRSRPADASSSVASPALTCHIALEARQLSQTTALSTSVIPRSADAT